MGNLGINLRIGRRLIICLLCSRFVFQQEKALYWQDKAIKVIKVLYLRDRIV